MFCQRMKFGETICREFNSIILQIARDGDDAALDRVDRDYISKHLNELDEKKLTPLHYAARNEFLLANLLYVFAIPNFSS